MYVQDIQKGTILAYEREVLVYDTVKVPDGIQSTLVGRRVERELHTVTGKPRRRKDGFAVPVIDSLGIRARAILRTGTVCKWTIVPSTVTPPAK